MVEFEASEDVDTNVIIEVVQNVTGASVVSVTIETDEATGKIYAAVTVAVGEDTADLVVAAVKEEIAKGDSCQAGLLCRAKSIEIKPIDKSEGSIAAAAGALLLIHVAALAHAM